MTQQKVNLEDEISKTIKDEFQKEDILKAEDQNIEKKDASGSLIKKKSSPFLSSEIKKEDEVKKEDDNEEGKHQQQDTILYRVK